VNHVQRFCNLPDTLSELKALAQQLANQASRVLSVKEGCPAYTAEIPWVVSPQQDAGMTGLP